MEVRTADREDLPVIANFIRKLAEYERLEGELSLSEAQLAETLFGERKYAHVILAFVGSRPVGFALYYFAYSTFLASPVLYLEDIFVLEEHRRQGVGRRLFGELLKIARKEKCGRFEWSVLDWNVSAIQFYEGLGARAQNEWIRHRLDQTQIQRLLDGDFC